MNLPPSPESNLNTKEKQALDLMVHESLGVNPLYDFLFDAGLRAFAPYFKGDHILELGAGSCNFTQKLLACAKQVDTVEGSTIICNRLNAKSLVGLTVIDSLFEEFHPHKNIPMSLHPL